MSILDLSRYDILTELKPYTQVGVIGLGCGEDLEFFARVRKRKRFTGFGWGDLSAVRKKTRGCQNVQLVKYNGAHLPVKNNCLESLLISEELQYYMAERRVLEPGIYKVNDFLAQKILHAHRLVMREGMLIFYGSLTFVGSISRAIYSSDAYGVELQAEEEVKHFSSAYSYAVFRRKKEESDDSL